jgi:hypothetical protein
VFNKGDKHLYAAFVFQTVIVKRGFIDETEFCRNKPPFMKAESRDLKVLKEF